MAVPRNITREHIEAALDMLDQGVQHGFGQSTGWDLAVRSRHYAPKAVVGLAAKLATGVELGPYDCSGGESDGAANGVLRALGFDVVAKTVAKPTRPVWLEITRSSHQHGGPGWEFATCLWSPSKNRGASDSYAIMREPRPGDLVLHCLDSIICGQSNVRASYREVAEEPPSPGPWAGMSPYYRIEVGDYRDFSRPYPLGQLTREHEEEIRADLADNDPHRYPFFIQAN